MIRRLVPPTPDGSGVRWSRQPTVPPSPPPSRSGFIETGDAASRVFALCAFPLDMRSDVANVLFRAELIERCDGQVDKYRRAAFPARSGCA